MPKTILVADDNPIIRKALCQLFEREEGYELCEQARDGKEAIEIALRCRPDLIILDLSMPVMNGIEAARRLKKLMPEVPIFLFTMHAHVLGGLVDPSENFIDLVVPKTNPSVLMNHVKAFLPLS
jgi:CheY-like chemotaxis protein